MSRKGLGNPALVTAIATNPKVLERAESGVRSIKNTLFALAGISVLIIGGIVVYRKFFSFSKLAYDTRYMPSNISEYQAELRANALESALKGIGADFEAVKRNIGNLNKNGIIALYNAFGERRGYDLRKMNLFQWLIFEFEGNEDKYAQLKFIMKGLL